MAHDEAPKQIASRGSDWDQYARRQVTFDDQDSIIDVLTSDIAVHRSGKLLQQRVQPTSSPPGDRRRGP